MGALSDRMKKAGWPIVRERNGSWVVYASQAREYRYDPSTGWSVPEKDLAAALENDLLEIQQGRLSAIRTLSRTTALNHARKPSQPIVRVCQDGRVDGKRVLHLGTGLDRFAKDALLKAGAVSVDDYDPNFYPNRSVLDSTYDVVLCNYVLNILTPAERRLVYDDIAACTAPQGSAYLCVQGKWPVLNKHRVVRKHEDGYLIRDTNVPTFRKGYDSQELIDEVCGLLHGTAELVCMFYNNSLVQWRPDKPKAGKASPIILNGKMEPRMNTNKR
ncbi:class I SAM-dependent methyltransferase [Pontiella sulfatireligans]|uniref:Methyltransferase type 11 domain-containing protein n=1 Tax=Pontiella sulfatireligans TaxID=2750658 RepID=A0A6C2UMC1_9BACT|nr:class I SAM-dependent methyltransferase [Pontiella sulfatireligans]VGO21278.1 hypothetical protein SCARR_03350 [Pontiella sulfatireligans]